MKWVAMVVVLMGAIATSWAAVTPMERVEGLVMPGELVQGHARFETKCDKCHQTFDKTKQTSLCRDCHEQIDIDVKKQKGFHGKIHDADKRECKSCHTDHKGREADIVQLDHEVFDHSRTEFELRGTHQSLTCDNCHKKPKFFRIPKYDCIDCHEEDDSHKGRMGRKCNNCHFEAGWLPANFNHDKTDFPLRNAHQDVSCQYCHVNERYLKTPKNCYFCHYLDDVHKGDRGVKCHQCHHDEKWARIEFDHDKDTNFKLNGTHKTVLCKDCHEGNMFKEKTKTACFACHEGQDSHYGKNGKRCDGCHTEKSWREIRFDHDKDTSFKLKGEHKEQACEACHKGDIFKVKTPVECAECHRLDDAHDGQQGEKCTTCHNENGWTKKVVFDHDITKFPLHGTHQVVSCEDCHTSERFKDAEFRCVSCHEKDDVHKKKLGKNCELCHGPADWLIWLFDHNTQTDFPLDGKHEGLDCHACHTRPVKDKIELPNNCFGCHEKDDNHAGQLGRQCERCHVTKSFKTIRIKDKK
ncbi:MAG TPA: cytochrome c3 family protein [Gammaproteobacteria bacterium]